MFEVAPARSLGDGLRCLDRGLALVVGDDEGQSRSALEAAYGHAAADAVRAALDAGTLTPDDVVRNIPARLAETPAVRGVVGGED
jgi:hypothetical protein